MNRTVEQIIRQHYVPACYLARFTLKGERGSPFYVHPPDDSPAREDIPAHVGLERHYHDIDIPGFRPDHLEFEFQKVEEPACALFKKLSANPGRELETESEKDAALLFFVVQAARVPQSKEKYRKLMVDGGRTFMKALAYSPEFFDRAMAVTKRHGVVTDPVEQAWLREAVNGGHIIPHADETQLSVGLFRLAYGILEQLEGMHYTLWYSDGPDWFVSSDYPAGIFYLISTGDVLEDPTTIENPTVQLLTTTMYMPLAYNAALVIHPHDNIPTVQRANRRMVAVVNSITISHAERFICSPTPDFVCVLPDGGLGNAKEAVQVLRSLASEGGRP